MVSTIEKGDELEDKFYQYLLEQQSRESLVYEVYPSNLCKIHKKKKYYCEQRENYVTFDVVVEVYRQGSTSPHLYVIFECKNYEGAISEDKITDFSDKVGRIFGHAAKGVVVVSSRLQSGAEKVAKKRKMGIVKYDEHGIETIADRKSGPCVEYRFIEAQIFKNESPVKSLRFSAYHDGNFFGSIEQFLRCLDSSQSADSEFASNSVGVSIPYVSDEAIKSSTHKLLEQIAYKDGSVDLNKICLKLHIDLQFTNQTGQDGDGNFVLGSANFDRKSILIYPHDNKNRERFTIAHEVGHFCLRHDQYLLSETFVERDLFISDEKENSFNYERLEFQANMFASDLLLPDKVFLEKTAECRKNLGIEDRGHGYIFVDDQPCNYGPYNQLLFDLSSYFEVSMQAIEIKFKKNGMLTDQRKKPESLSNLPFMSGLGT